MGGAVRVVVHEAICKFITSNHGVTSEMIAAQT